MFYTGIQAAQETSPEIRGVSISPTEQQYRILNYNVQNGIACGAYVHYVTNGWKHLLPCASRLGNLDRIARLLRDFDLVGLQEVDSGSLRTEFVNQTEYLSLKARFPYWYQQTNRRLGPLAQQSNGLLSRLRPREILEFALPGLPGRGALVAHFGGGETSLTVCVVHLALGRRGRLRQIDFLGKHIGDCRNLIVMGDFNCGPETKEMTRLCNALGLEGVDPTSETYPSWRPKRRLDHVLVSPQIRIDRSYVPHWLFSDHLPVALEFALPFSIHK